MPCDIGYKSVARARVETADPQTFESRTSAPEIDAELLDRLGIDDPVFLDWVRDLDTGPLLERALERAGAAVRLPSGTEASIRDGRLVARARYSTPRQKASATQAIDALARRWQLEVLGIVAEVLGCRVNVTTQGEGGRNVLVLEGEKDADEGVSRYLRITIDGAGGTEVRFEHFASEEELSAEETRFLALAQRLGVRVVVAMRRRDGSAITPGIAHRHPRGRGGKA